MSWCPMMIARRLLLLHPLAGSLFAREDQLQKDGWASCPMMLVPQPPARRFVPLPQHFLAGSLFARQEQLQDYGRTSSGRPMVIAGWLVLLLLPHEQSPAGSHLLEARQEQLQHAEAAAGTW